jgi:hypothetical protein
MSNTNPYTVLAELDKPEKTRLTGKSSLTAEVGGLSFENSSWGLAGSSVLRPRASLEVFVNGSMRGHIIRGPPLEK